MNLSDLLETVPPYARDLKLNFSTLTQQTDLNEQQIWGTVVGYAVASRNPELTQTLLAEASGHLSPSTLEAAKGAAAIMGMNHNIYHRFLHLTSNSNYQTLPARLRMNILRSHGVDHVDFELWCAAVSAINGCAACVDSHEQVIRKQGLSEQAVLAAIRIAAVVHGLAAVLDAEPAPVAALSA
jgi:lipoyl-dependent peroxiredoxin subunit D